MSKIYTKVGDRGNTTLFGGSTIRKADHRVEAYGAVDEANSMIGLAAVFAGNQVIADLLRLCQKKLFIVGAELASDERGKRSLSEHISKEDVQLLEQSIDAFCQALPQNLKFIVPGRSRASAYLHVARTTVRRAERNIVAIMAPAHVNPNIIVFMNRLSDLLFVLSRTVDEVDAFKPKKEI